MQQVQGLCHQVCMPCQVPVVIARHPCVMIKSKEKSAKQKLVFMVNKAKCNKCKVCVTRFACRAMFIDEDGTIAIDQALCNGCGVCVQVCLEKAIGVRR